MATFLLVLNERRYQLFAELLALASRGKPKCSFVTHIKNVEVAKDNILNLYYYYV
jgi:hypothetical protein